MLLSRLVSCFNICTALIDWMFVKAGFHFNHNICGNEQTGLRLASRQAICWIVELDLTTERIKVKKYMLFVEQKSTF